ncbi:MAG: hypothetical protein MUC63_10000 [Planctomycetes bacterium]|nr:hypothetical protein [Planctomycetota bacterium]
MTSINAMKFNEHAGACVYDEERGWNDEGLKSLSVEKMKPVSWPKVVEETGLVAVYGNTGTSTIGDELRHTIGKRLLKEYEKAASAAGGKPEKFLTIADVAKLAFQTITDLKHTHIDQEMVGRYGFNTKDFVAGAYSAGGKKADIKDGELVKKIDEMITWKARSKGPTAVFLNAGIIAGWEPREGFRVFHLCMIEHVCEPVQEIFLADGSGRDMTTVVFTEFANSRKVPERRGNVDRVEGLTAMLRAILAAMRHDIGVSGYPNIICMDGRKPKNADKMWLVNDHRAKLASELVLAGDEGWVPRRRAADLLESLVFEGGTFAEVEASLLRSARDPKALVRFLRGYPVARPE